MRSSRQERRIYLQTIQSCQFIDPEQYTKLVLSRRSLVRIDDEVADLCGLKDIHTGEVFYIEQERLFSSELATN